MHLNLGAVSCASGVRAHEPVPTRLYHEHILFGVNGEPAISASFASRPALRLERSPRIGVARCSAPPMSRFSP